MGQRHNRRRTRPRPTGRKRCANNIAIAIASPSPSTYTSSFSSASPSALDCLGNRLASTRHCNRGLTWQEREHILRLEATMLETEQCRLFGGEPGDDVGLCYRMLEYFGGLDYIDPLQNLKMKLLPG